MEDHLEPNNGNSKTGIQKTSKQHRYWEMKIQTSHQNKELKKKRSNGISEKRLSKSYIVTVGNIPMWNEQYNCRKPWSIVERKSRWSGNTCRNKWFDKQCHIIK